MAGHHSTFFPDFGKTTLLSPADDDVDDLEGVFFGERGRGVNNPVVYRKLDLSSPKKKRQKVSVEEEEEDGGPNSDGRQKVSHMTVERNRRKQMNHQLTLLRSLMPRFYVKRGDQASIIGGVVDYITELQQILQTLEAKKQRKVYSQVLMSPRLAVSSPLSPRPSLPLSPQPAATPYISTSSLNHSSPANSFITTYSDSGSNEVIMANLKSAIVEVEVKLVGGNNLVLKTCSKRMLGQATKVIRILENLSLEVLQANINIVDEAMVNSFTIKIGVECQLSAEELAQHIQSSFC